MPERLEDLARSFARHLRAEGKAEGTAVIYGQSVTFYGRWLVEQARGHRRRAEPCERP